MMAFVGTEAAEALYWLLKVAVPQIRGGRIVERGGWVGGILEEGIRISSVRVSGEEGGGKSIQEGFDDVFPLVDSRICARLKVAVKVSGFVTHRQNIDGQRN